MTTWPQISIDTNLDESMCFGCGQDNPIGLKLNFQWDGHTARTEFTPTDLYQGYSGLLHGGITTSILDEAASYAALFEGLHCLTARMQIEFKYPIPVNEPLIVTSSVIRKRRKLVECQAAISLANGTLVAEGVATQYIVGTVNTEDKKSLKNSIANRRSLSNMERSLVLIKPDAVQKRLAGTIIGRLEGQGLKLVALKMLHLDAALAEKHYAIHAEKPFFTDLIKFITSAPIVALILEGKNAVNIIRKTMGPTDPAQAEAGTIRGDFGSDIQQNAVHGSDAAETAEQEIGLFFGDAEVLGY